MREAVHIFLKDSRQLRVPIAIVLSWTVMFAWAGEPLAYWEQAPVGVFGYLVAHISNYVLPVGWAYLIAQAVHADALPGDRQFWVTRPYRRSSLFGAKALFMLVYVALPVMLAQGWILAWQGFPLRSFVAELLWTQVLMLAVVVVPVGALSALTSSFVQFVVAAVSVPLLILAYNVQTPWGPSAWFRTSLGVSGLAAVAGTVVLLQFVRRRTGTSRLVALGGILLLVATLPLLSWRAAFAVQTELDPAGSETLQAELLRQEPRREPRARKPGEQPLPYVMAFRFPGLSPETPLLCEALETTFDGPDGRSWHTGLVRLSGSYTTYADSRAGDGCRSYVRLPEGFVERVGDGAVRLRAALYVTVFGHQRATRVPIGTSPTLVPDVGLCGGTKHQLRQDQDGDGQRKSFSRVECQMALRAPRGLVRLSTGVGSDTHVFPSFSYSPFPADLTIRPVTRTYRDFAPVDEITVVTFEPVAHVRTEVDVQDVHLSDFELTSGR